MIKIITIIGTRPQFIKAAVISREIRNHYADSISEKIIHTGQHYDTNMSDVFFEELNIPAPAYHLNIGSEAHGKQTAGMLIGIEKILTEEHPDYVLVYGDTNSTLAGALAASKMGLKLIHIEAGLRSLNKGMPEEINRILCDHISSLLFVPTHQGLENLKREGFALENRGPFHIDNPGVIACGDIMYDSALYFSKIADEKSLIMNEQELEAGKYFLVTLHRGANTDDPAHLNAIFSALDRISRKYEQKVIVPIHPRTLKKWKELKESGIKEKIAANKLIKFIPPASYIDFICLEKNCRMIMTDSGGVQKEAYFFEKKCVILREETEWTELLEQGIAELCGANEEKIVAACDRLLQKTGLTYPPIYGDGHAARFILEKIVENAC